MRNALIAMLLAMGFAGQAWGEQIAVTASGSAEAPAARAVVTAASLNALAYGDDGDGEDAPAAPAPTPDAIADIIRRADPTARPAPFNQAVLDTMPWLVMVQASGDVVRYEIDAVAAPRVEQGLAPFRPLMQIHYEALSADAAALRTAALRDALTNARARAGEVAAAANLRLGDVVRIENSTGPAEAAAGYVISIGGNHSKAPTFPLKATDTEAVTVTFDAAR